MALVGVPSRMQVIWETVFCIPDPNPLLYVQKEYNKIPKQVITMSTIVALENLTNDDLKKHLSSLIALEDWTDECSKCGYPKLLHKDYVLHRDAACTREMEVPNILRENWKEFTKRVKPILKIMKDDFKRDMEQGILMQGLKELINSNGEIMGKSLDSKKSNVSLSPSHDTGAARVSKLTKPEKVPTWTKDMSLETYVKHLVTWQGINEDVPEYVKYHDIIEELKKNKDIKGLQRFIADHILPFLVKIEDQTVDKVARLLDSRYGRT